MPNDVNDRLIDECMELLSTCYLPESEVYTTVRRALGKLARSDLEALHVMIETSRGMVEDDECCTS